MNPRGENATGLLGQHDTQDQLGSWLRNPGTKSSLGKGKMRGAGFEPAEAYATGS